MTDHLIRYFPELTGQQRSQFQLMLDCYKEWNDKINVISRKDMEELEVRHVLHSLAIAKFIRFQPGTTILDFGTGGGFPGIPLAVMFPDVQFTLIDSIGKKIKVVQALTDELGLKNVLTAHNRVEEVDGKFDFVTCRAVGRLNKILPWVKRSLKSENKNEWPNGYLFLKGGDLDEELAEVKVSYRRIPIKNYFSEAFFETKEIVYLSPNI